jgi:hypothetical protein
MTPLRRSQTRAVPLAAALTRGQSAHSGGESTRDLAAARLIPPRLVLEPLRLEHADELRPLLSDASLHRFIGGIPPTPHQLQARLRRTDPRTVARRQGIACLWAHIHPSHDASMAVAGAIGLHPTNTMVDGERRWQST